MIRLVNVLALIAVISSATWAYSVKYETILVAEKLRKREAELTRERDAVAMLQAEWHLLNRPERLQSLAKPEAGMQTVTARHVARPADIPEATPEKGDKIDALLTGSIPTPDSARNGAARTASMTPSSQTTSAKTGPVKTGPARTSAARTPITGDARTAARSAPARAASQPTRLTPPARVGAQPKQATPPTVAAAPASEKPSGGLTGFLRNLIR